MRRKQSRIRGMEGYLKKVNTISHSKRVLGTATSVRLRNSLYCIPNITNVNSRTNQ